MGPTLVAAIPPSLLDVDYSFKSDRELFEFEEINPKDVEELLMQRPDYKSMGLVGFLSNLLKINTEVSSLIICHIIHNNLVI